MTVLDFATSYQDCAINDVPVEMVSAILDIVPTAPGAGYARSQIIRLIKDEYFTHCGLRFRNGSYCIKKPRDSRVVRKSLSDEKKTPNVLNC